MSGIRWIAPTDPPEAFPDVSQALAEPNGLIAAGGDLSMERLLSAYARGIFPWYEAGQPVLWWSPDPRAVLLPAKLHVSRSLRRTLRRSGFEVSFDSDFGGVIEGCAAPRSYASGTWITPELQAAFRMLHRRGYAHSVEVRQGGRLVGGLYGLALGRVFFGESMFSVVTDASKVALLRLVERLSRHGFELIDCQIRSAHLDSLGSRLMPRAQFIARLGSLVRIEPWPEPWQERG